MNMKEYKVLYITDGWHLVTAASSSFGAGTGAFVIFLEREK